MTSITLAQKVQGAHSRKVIYFDKVTQDTPLVVDNAAFAPAQDLVYDVKGLEEALIRFNNTGANSIDMLIEKASKEFTLLSELVDADFVEEVAEATIAAAANSVDYTNTNITPEITALRFRFKESAGGSPGEAKFVGGGLQ